MAFRSFMCCANSFIRYVLTLAALGKSAFIVCGLIDVRQLRKVALFATSKPCTLCQGQQLAGITVSLPGHRMRRILLQHVGSPYGKTPSALTLCRPCLASFESRLEFGIYEHTEYWQVCNALTPLYPLLYSVGYRIHNVDGYGLDMLSSHHSETLF